MVEAFLIRVNQYLAQTHQPRIPLHLRSYSVEVHVPPVQAYFDHAYPDAFQICVFDERGSHKPIYKGPRDARQHIGIVHMGAHFHGIRNISSFFSRERYCVSCEKPYQYSEKQHSRTCRLRCRGCFECGFGKLVLHFLSSIWLLFKDILANRMA
jgi:hypothetical protein